MLTENNGQRQRWSEASSCRFQTLLLSVWHSVPQISCPCNPASIMKRKPSATSWMSAEYAADDNGSDLLHHSLYYADVPLRNCSLTHFCFLVERGTYTWSFCNLTANGLCTSAQVGSEPVGDSPSETIGLFAVTVKVYHGRRCRKPPTGRAEWASPGCLNPGPGECQTVLWVPSYMHRCFHMTLG